MSWRAVEAASILAGWHFATQLVEEVQQHGYPIRGPLLLLPCPGRIQNNREALAVRCQIVRVIAALLRSDAKMEKAK